MAENAFLGGVEGRGVFGCGHKQGPSVRQCMCDSQRRKGGSSNGNALPRLVHVGARAGIADLGQAGFHRYVGALVKHLLPGGDVGQFVANVEYR